MHGSVLLLVANFFQKSCDPKNRIGLQDPGPGKLRLCTGPGWSTKPTYRIMHILMYAYYCSQIPAPDWQDQQTNRQDQEKPSALGPPECLRKALPGEPQEQIRQAPEPEILRCLMPCRWKVVPKRIEREGQRRHFRQPWVPARVPKDYRPRFR